MFTFSVTYRRRNRCRVDVAQRCFSVKFIRLGTTETIDACLCNSSYASQTKSKQNVRTGGSVGGPAVPDGGMQLRRQGDWRAGQKNAEHAAEEVLQEGGSGGGLHVRWWWWWWIGLFKWLISKIFINDKLIFVHI